MRSLTTTIGLIATIAIATGCPEDDLENNLNAGVDLGVDQGDGEADQGTADTALDEGNGSGPPFEVVDCDAATIATDVSVVDFDFEPSDPSVNVGEVIRFTHEGTVPHTVTSGRQGENPAELFDSGSLEAADTYCLQANQAGSYPYFCTIHPVQMTGTIEVTP